MSETNRLLARLQERYPKVYKELKQQTRRRPVPAKRMAALTSKAQRLADGIRVVVPVQKRAFLVKARFYWEGLDCAGLLIEGYQPNPQAAKRTEKALVQQLWYLCENGRYGSDGFTEEVREEVWNCKEQKAFSKKLEAFQKELDHVEATYDFDYDRDIGIESEFA